MASERDVFINFGPGLSIRERELQAAAVRSVAARASSGQTAITKWAKKTFILDDTKEAVQPEQKHQRQEDAETSSARARLNSRCITELSPELPDPSSYLGQGQVDPFDHDPLRNLSQIARKTFEYALVTMWPKLFPGFTQAALNGRITQCRRDIVQSQLEFHTLVWSAVSQCYSLSADPRTRHFLLEARLKHQSAALRMLRERITTLKGPPSDEVIESISRFSAQGGDMQELKLVRRYPTSPMVDRLPQYSCFEPCPPHMQALHFLVRQRGGLEAMPPMFACALSMHVSVKNLFISDTLTSTRLGIRPTFAIPKGLKLVSENHSFHLDAEAVELRSRMGTGWVVLESSHPSVVVLATRAGELTTAVDQIHRRGNACNSSPLYSILVNVFQHELLTLDDTPGSSNPPPAASTCVQRICLLSLQIYSDVVFLPTPVSSGLRERLAGQLREALAVFFVGHGPVEEAIYCDLIRWALVMGTVAAETLRSHRQWYLRQLRMFFLNEKPCWETFKSSLTSFLWWDYTFDKHVRDIWRDARAYAYDENFTFEIPEDITDLI